MKLGAVLIRNVDQANELTAQVQASAAQLHTWLAAFNGDSIGLLRALKFNQVGVHPLDGHPLNAIEQINQAWTYLVALSAVRFLFDLHPGAGSFRIAPGAHAAQPLDVMSEIDGLVGAETFAAVDPRNNRKLAKDLMKLANREEKHRYVFFASPLFPGTARRRELEQHGVQVWSLDV